MSPFKPMDSNQSSNIKNTQKQSLAEIREKGQKPNWRRDGNMLARYWARPTAVYGTWLALRVGCSAHLITTLAALAWVIEAACIARGQMLWFQVGVLFGFVGFWLDHVDGQLARVTGNESVDGIFLDFWMHTAHGLLRAFSLGCGLHAATGHDQFLMCGMAVAFGWTMLSHANDAKYKAFMAQINKFSGRWSVQKPEMQSAEREPRPLVSLRRILIWPLAKFQEAHVVLFVEAAIGLLFFFKPFAAWLLWKYAMFFWAISAPVLAVARVGRMVRSRQADREFYEWFHGA